MDFVFIKIIPNIGSSRHQNESIWYLVLPIFSILGNDTFFLVFLVSFVLSVLMHIPLSTIVFTVFTKIQGMGKGD